MVYDLSCSFLNIIVYVYYGKLIIFMWGGYFGRSGELGNELLILSVLLFVDCEYVFE